MTTKDDIVRDSVKGSVNRKSRRLLFGLVMIALVSLIVSAVAAVFAYQTISNSAKSGVELAQNVRTQCNTSTSFATQNPDLCGNADNVIEEAPSTVRGEQGEPGVPGEPGRPPSDAEVLNAVALYCAGNNCDGRDGSDASPAQVAQAVATYCDDRGQCRGPEGIEGDQGDTGETGAQGPPPTGEQVAGAVASYCATRNECRGPTGAEGPVGPTGVINTTSNCDAPEGQKIDEVRPNYDADSRTLIINCTYVDDPEPTGPLPTDPSPTT